MERTGLDGILLVAIDSEGTLLAEAGSREGMVLLPGTEGGEDEEGAVTTTS